VVINRSISRQHEADLARVEEALSLPLAGVLPLDTKAVQRALGDGRPVVCDPRSKLRRPLQRLLEQVHGGELRMPRATAPRRSTRVFGRVRGALAACGVVLGGSQ
jgi:Flp pilus assembly CpaE family ATPase